MYFGASRDGQACWHSTMVWKEEGAPTGIIELSPNASDLNVIYLPVLVGSFAKRLLTIFFLTL